MKIEHNRSRPSNNSQIPNCFWHGGRQPDNVKYTQDIIQFKQYDLLYKHADLVRLCMWVVSPWCHSQVWPICRTPLFAQIWISLMSSMLSPYLGMPTYGHTVVINSYDIRHLWCQSSPYVCSKTAHVRPVNFLVCFFLTASKMTERSLHAY